MDPQKVIDESRPMLVDFLCDTGLYTRGEPFDLQLLLAPFSTWIDAQEVLPEDRFYLASRVFAFICEYLIDHHNGQRLIVEGRINMYVPIQGGVTREFDPYATALGIVDEHGSLQTFLETLCR
jgi:hypothetical protein